MTREVSARRRPAARAAAPETLAPIRGRRDHARAQRRMIASTPARLLVCLSALAAACAGPGLPAGFAAAAAAAPEDTPARLWIDGDAVVAAAAGVGPGGLPLAVRTAIDAVAPGGELQFAGREWSAAGDGYRVDKRYVDGPDESFRSALIAADGAVLERSHSVPIGKVPTAVLTAALTVGRDVRRCEIVADAAQETGWRAIVSDGAGRSFVATIGLQGGLRSVYRIVNARLGLLSR